MTINDLLTTEAERIEWPENTKPKFTRKRGTKMTKVAYNTKTKRYNTSILTRQYQWENQSGELSQTHTSTSVTIKQKEYVVINAPNRLEPNTKYVVTAPYCHWIWERSITVLALLSYAICNTHLTRGVVKSAIKDVHTEEALRQRIAEQECYTELVQTITKAITDISETENPSVGYKNKKDEIYGVIKFIREKRVKPSCKILSGDSFQTFRQQPKTQVQWTWQGTL